MKELFLTTVLLLVQWKITQGQDCRICGPKAPDKPCTPDSPMTLPKDVKVTSKICSDIEDGQRAYQEELCKKYPKPNGYFYQCTDTKTSNTYSCQSSCGPPLGDVGKGLNLDLLQGGGLFDILSGNSNDNPKTANNLKGKQRNLLDLFNKGNSGFKTNRGFPNSDLGSLGGFDTDIEFPNSDFGTLEGLNNNNGYPNSGFQNFGGLKTKSGYPNAGYGNGLGNFDGDVTRSQSKLISGQGGPNFKRNQGSSTNTQFGTFGASNQNGDVSSSKDSDSGGFATSTGSSVQRSVSSKKMSRKASTIEQPDPAYSNPVPPSEEYPNVAAHAEAYPSVESNVPVYTPESNNPLTGADSTDSESSIVTEEDPQTKPSPQDSSSAGGSAPPGISDAKSNPSIDQDVNPFLANNGQGIVSLLNNGFSGNGFGSSGNPNQIGGDLFAPGRPNFPHSGTKSLLPGFSGNSEFFQGKQGTGNKGTTSGSKFPSSSGSSSFQENLKMSSNYKGSQTDDDSSNLDSFFQPFPIDPSRLKGSSIGSKSSPIQPVKPQSSFTGFGAEQLNKDLPGFPANGFK